MTEDTLLLFDLPAVSRKKVTADFEGGWISSDGGLVLLRAAERRLGLAEALAGCIREWRDPERVRTSWSQARARMVSHAASMSVMCRPGLFPGMTQGLPGVRGRAARTRAADCER